MSRFDSIDLSRLPPPAVLENLDYDGVLLPRRIDRLKQEAAADGIVYDTGSLESGPLKWDQRTVAYFELLLRNRVNQAAAAVMPALAVGTDLDAIAARYAVARRPVVENPRPYPDFPEDWEDDDSFRRLVQLAPEALTTAGSAGAFVFQALKASVDIKDATAICIGRGTNKVAAQVVIMQKGPDPRPTDEQRSLVYQRLVQEDIQPLTDVVIVRPPKIAPVTVKARLTLYPGPDANVVLASANAALDTQLSDIAWLGKDLTISALYKALHQPGVQSVTLLSPTTNVVVGPDGCVLVTDRDVRVAGRDE